MTEFSEDVISKSDHFFVEEDAARIYRDLKDVLVEELGIDRVEEARMEFSTSSAKDKIRMHAWKEKSRHTVLYFNLSWRCKTPRHIYQSQRAKDVLKARVKTKAKVLTTYPGGEAIPWLPEHVTDTPQKRIPENYMRPEDTSMFQNSKFYDILTTVWYNTFYRKEIDRYEEEAEEMVLHLHNLMREKFGVEESITKSGASQYTPPWQ
ncbi:MAG: hypothetical protein ACI977_000834 [Candidatus Nanohaloarchaea archaeon]|jgi:hypothetical protein